MTAVNECYVARSVEKRITLVQLTSNRGHGCYATFTDADLAKVATPKNGQFRTSVLVCWSLTNRLRSLRCSPTTPTAQTIGRLSK